MEQWVKKNIGNSSYRGTVATEGQGNICHSGKMGQNAFSDFTVKMQN